MSENMARELGWDDLIENESPEYITLPEGDYDFTVSSFERGRYEPRPGAKLPPCNMAILNLWVKAPDGASANIQHKLYLHSTTEGLLCAFFTAIGQRKHGEAIRMNWGAVVGSSGRAKVGIRKYTKDGEERTINEIKRFYDPEENEEQAPAKSAAYEPGKF